MSPLQRKLGVTSFLPSHQGRVSSLPSELLLTESATEVGASVVNGSAVVKRPNNALQGTVAVEDNSYRDGDRIDCCQDWAGSDADGQCDSGAGKGGAASSAANVIGSVSDSLFLILLPFPDQDVVFDGGNRRFQQGGVESRSNADFEALVNYRRAGVQEVLAWDIGPRFPRHVLAATGTVCAGVLPANDVRVSDLLRMILHRESMRSILALDKLSYGLYSFGLYRVWDRSLVEFLCSGEGSLPAVHTGGVELPLQPPGEVAEGDERSGERLCCAR